MKKVSIDTKTVNAAAAERGFTPEEYVARLRSISCGRKVCAHLERKAGRKSVFCVR